MSLMVDKMDDFISATINSFKRKNWVDLSLDKQHYIFFEKFMKGTKTRRPHQGGANIEWKLQVDKLDNAHWNELYAVDRTGVKDLLDTAKVPFAKASASWSYDLMEDSFNNSDKERIIREIDVRKNACYSDLAELMEDSLWSAPASSTQSPRQPYGIPFWIQKSATTPGGGFTGGDPSGFSDGAAGVKVSDVPNWSNWSFNYDTAGSRDDLVAKLRKAITHTKFKSPKPYNNLDKSGNTDWAFYTNYDVIAELEKLLESRNDNLGADLAKYMGSVLVKGNPVIWVPALDSETDDPIYGVNHQVLAWHFKTGYDFVEHKPIAAPNQHLVRNVFIDTSGNFVCYNRRRLFVGYKD